MEELKIWEWRIFYWKESFNLWDRLKQKFDKIDEVLEKETTKQRTDYYFDIQNPMFGLKERGNYRENEYKPKLELKIRLNIDPDTKAELWAKSVSKKVSATVNEKSGLSSDTIVTLLKEEMIQHPDYSDHLDNVIKLLQVHGINRIRVEKDRKRIRGVYTEDNR